MSVRPLDDVWEVRGLPVVGDPCDPGQVTAEVIRAASPSDQRQAVAGDGGGTTGRIAIIRRQRSVGELNGLQVGNARLSLQRMR